MAEARWRNRIVGYGEEEPEQFLANEKNWRIHPGNQERVLGGVLDEVGLVQTVIVNKRTGKLVDGHLRVSMAITQGQPTVPVTYVDLSDEEEALILASFNPLGALAVPDEGALNELIGSIATDNPDVNTFLDGLFSEVNNAALKQAKEDAGIEIADDAEGGSAQEKHVVRVLMLIGDITTFEQAIMKTGAKSRGEAIVQICRSYLGANTDPKGQLNKDTESPATK